MTAMLTWLALCGFVALWPSRERVVPPAAHRQITDRGANPEPLRHDQSARTQQGLPTVDEAADALVLCALALRSGVSTIEALEAVARHLGGPAASRLRVVAAAAQWGQRGAQVWAHIGEIWRPAALAWEAAERSGAAPAAVVLAAAERMRAQESARIETAVGRAAVMLVLPLGLCFLPGFLATTVIPVIAHLARTSLGG